MGNFSCLPEDEGRAIEGDLVLRGRITILSGVAHCDVLIRRLLLHSQKWKAYADMAASG